MEIFCNYKNYSIIYSPLFGVTSIRGFLGFEIKTFIGYCREEGDKLAREYIDNIKEFSKQN